MDRIRETYPEWVQEDGGCPRCEHFFVELDDLSNLHPWERSRSTNADDKEALEERKVAYPWSWIREHLGVPPEDQTNIERLKNIILQRLGIKSAGSTETHLGRGSSPAGP